MRQILLLRGINLGPHRRIAMPKLRDALRDAGFGDVRTYLQSGNVVLSSDAAPAELAAACQRLLADCFGHEVDVLVRTRDELAAVVQLDPLRSVAADPKRYQVTFLREQPSAELVQALVARRASRRGRPGAVRVAPRRDRPLAALGAPRQPRARDRGHGAQLDDGDEPARVGRLVTAADPPPCGRSRASRPLTPPWRACRLDRGLLRAGG